MIYSKDIVQKICKKYDEIGLDFKGAIAIITNKKRPDIQRLAAIWHAHHDLPKQKLTASEAWSLIADIDRAVYPTLWVEALQFTLDLEEFCQES